MTLSNSKSKLGFLRNADLIIDSYQQQQQIALQARTPSWLKTGFLQVVSFCFFGALTLYGFHSLLETQLLN